MELPASDKLLMPSAKIATLEIKTPVIILTAHNKILLTIPTAPQSLPYAFLTSCF